MMREKIAYWFLLVVLVILSACSTDFEDISHTVVEVKDGNSIVLKNGIKVNLIGVSDTEASAEYLADKLLHRKVRVVFDKSNYPVVNSKTEEVWGYVLIENGMHINAFLLQQGLTSLDDEFLTDSLYSFSDYSQYTKNVPDEDVELDLPNSKKDVRPKPKKGVVKSRPAFKNFVDLVEYAEQCVFLVLARDEKGKTVSQGTGFFVADSGLAISNYHVFEEGVRWSIRTNSGKKYKVAEILEQNKDFDYIIFKVEKEGEEGFPYLPVAKSTPRKGTDIFVLGNPRGLESTITRGIVSAIRNQKGKQEAVIQIDAAISPGSSGSPVMNMDGKVVGIATYKARDCESCNFAMNIQLLDFTKGRERAN